tara:strand:- start:448 stop:786 length:339 start_codon:yes stop_codon:yes gene_type:complete
MYRLIISLAVFFGAMVAWLFISFFLSDFIPFVYSLIVASLLVGVPYYFFFHKPFEAKNDFIHEQELLEKHERILHQTKQLIAKRDALRKSMGLEPMPKEIIEDVVHEHKEKD